jgi:hypothetical protein
MIAIKIEIANIAGSMPDCNDIPCISIGLRFSSINRFFFAYSQIKNSINPERVRTNAYIAKIKK